MNISVSYDESDVAKALSKIIKDSNSEEFIKLLTPMICTSQPASEHFFKLMIGNKLPEIISEGTICKIAVNNLSYSCNKEGIREKFADADDKITVVVKQFRGYHEYSQYYIEYTDVLDSGVTKKDTAYVQYQNLEVIEDF